MIEELVTDTVYEAIREKLVVDGWLPDVKTFPNWDSDDEVLAEAAYDDFKSTMIGIQQTKGFCIELLGYSNSEYKNNKKAPRIVIDNHQMMPNEIGNDTRVYYEKETVGPNTYYLRKRSQNVLSDLTFTIYMVGSSVKQMMIMNMIIAECLPYRGYIKPLGEVTFKLYNNFFLNLIDKGRTADLLEGVMERYFIYKCTDLQEVPDQVLVGTRSLIKEIDLQLPPIE